MMVHPSSRDNVTPKNIAVSMFEVAYTGKEAHASASPELGINAADALTVAQTAIGPPQAAYQAYGPDSRYRHKRGRRP